LSLLAPVMAPFPRDAIDLSSSMRPAPPGTRERGRAVHLLGIDHLGRDLFTRLLYAARVSLSIAILVVLISESFGMFGCGRRVFRRQRRHAHLAHHRVHADHPDAADPADHLGHPAQARRGAALPAFIIRFLSGLLLAPEREAQKVVVLVLILVIFGWLGAAVSCAAWR
jgi:peptide/nickel transport system permease protein